MQLKEKPRLALTTLPTVKKLQRTKDWGWVNDKIYNLIKRKEIAQLLHRLMDSRCKKGRGLRRRAMGPTKISQEDIEGWNSWSIRNTDKFIWDISRSRSSLYCIFLI